MSRLEGMLSMFIEGIRNPSPVVLSEQTVSSSSSSSETKKPTAGDHNGRTVVMAHY